MTPTEFNDLGMEVREALIDQHGALVDEKTKGIYTIRLYALKKLYVEYFFNKRLDEVHAIRALETDIQWDNYLDNIQLPEL